MHSAKEIYWEGKQSHDVKVQEQAPTEQHEFSKTLFGVNVQSNDKVLLQGFP